MKVNQLQYILYAADMSRAVTFWRDVVGLDVRLETPFWSELTHGTAVVALHGGGDGAFRSTGLGVQVTDIDAACAEIVAGGGALRSGPVTREREGIKLADVTDPEGNGFAVSQYIR